MFFIASQHRLDNEKLFPEYSRAFALKKKRKIIIIHIKFLLNQKRKLFSPPGERIFNQKNIVRWLNTHSYSYRKKREEEKEKVIKLDDYVCWRQKQPSEKLQTKKESIDE
jgi:hypothetical protein